MADTDELDDKLNKLLARGKEIGEELAGKADATRVEELSTEQNTIKEQVGAIAAERKRLQTETDQAELMTFMEATKADAERRPSKADKIGTLTGDPVQDAGNFFATVAKAKSHDYEEQKAGKAALDSMGASWASVDPASKGSLKATLGTTDAAGGFLIPNAVVASLVEHGPQRNPWRELLTVVTGIRGISVEVPTEGLAPTRAGIVAWGDTKTNINLTVASYTATLYTLATIADVSNQLLRHSEGAAEQLVRSTLRRRFALGEAHYILNGTGSSEPKGLLTSIGASGTFVTSFTPSSTTLVGSVASALAIAAADVESRNREVTGAVVHPAVYWLMARQGTDSAGFFFAPSDGPEGIRPGTLMTPWGVPVYKDTNMPVDDLLIGDFKSAQMFLGDDYRVDTSTEAGDRWDKNLTGFRAEEEIGFNADPYVVAGFFQLITDVTP